MPGLRCGLSFLVVAALFGLAGGQGANQTTVPITADVPLTCVVEMGDLAATPACNSVEFQFDLTNGQGNVPYDALPYIHVFAPDGGFLENVSGSSVNVSKGGSATVTVAWDATGRADGTYSASAFANASAAVACAPAGPRNATFNVSSSLCPAPAGAAGGGGAAPAAPAAAIPPPAEHVLSIRSFDVLLETRPGADATASMVVENVHTAPVDLSIRPGGLPFPVRAEPETLRLDPGQRAAITLSFQVPEGAAPGDHRVLVGFGPDVPDEVFFLARVRPHDPGRANVFRAVALDRDAGATRISIEFRNGPNPVPRAEVVEEIPKRLASDASQIRFITPGQVLEADPVVRFILRDLKPHEVRTLEYEVANVLEELTPYVYFPVKQINVFTSVTPLRLELLRPLLGPLSPGAPGQVRLPFENREAFPVEVAVQLETPAGWGVEPAVVVRTLPPGPGELRFTVSPPPEAAGRAILTFRVEAQGQEFLTQAVVVIETSPWPLVAALAAAGVAGAFLVQRQISLSRRRARERAVRLIEFRQRMRR